MKLKPYAAILIGSALVGGAVETSFANGRPPATKSVHTRPGHPESIYVGTTFGMLISQDDGCSFRWLCEQNVGYAGDFDPKYQIAEDGTIYATTYEGLRVSRDGGCNFETATETLPAGTPGKISGLWVDAIFVPPSGDVWVATAESGGSNNVYRSKDQGRTFSPMNLESAQVWYKSITVSGATEQRVWATGYQVGGGDSPVAHLYRSDDGAATWTEVPMTGFAFAATPVVLVESADKVQGEVMYVRSVGANLPGGDVLYRSADSGQTWKEVLRTVDAIRSVVPRQGGAVLVATVATGEFQSSDMGQTFTAVTGSPKMSCLAEREDRQLLTCAANWEPDFLAVGKSSDGMQWQKIFRFVEMAGPLSCARGTAQYDVCESQIWPSLREQFGVTGPSCPGFQDGAPKVDAAGTPPPKKDSGCCGVGTSVTDSTITLVMFALGVGGGLRRRRRAVTKASACSL